MDYYQAIIDVSFNYLTTFNYVIKQNCGGNILWLYPRVSIISLLLHKSEAKPRMSINNKDMYHECTWNITGLLLKRLYQSMFFSEDKAMALVNVHPLKLFCHYIKIYPK